MRVCKNQLPANNADTPCMVPFLSHIYSQAGFKRFQKCLPDAIFWFHEKLSQYLYDIP
jgi:hypothetical protein